MSIPRKTMDERLRESASRPGKLRVVGERGPDETGMLKMLPVGEGREPPAEDVGATAFFRVPVNPERARPVIVPMEGPVVAARGGAAPARVAAPVVAAPVVAAPAASRRAPVAEMQPFASPGFVPPGSGGAAVVPAGAPEPRIQSMRVLAVLSFVFLLASALVLTTVIVLLGVGAGAPEARDPGPEVRAAGPVTQGTEDTGGPRIVPDDPPPDVGPGGGGKKLREKPVLEKRAPPPAPGDVTVRFSGAVQPTLVEITCPGVDRKRASLVGGAATVSGVPAGAECRMYPKGTVVATTVPVQAGKSYDCRLEGTTTTCR